MKINSLPLNNCFSHRNVLQNGAKAQCQKWFLKTRFFVNKVTILNILDHTIWFKFRQHRFKYVSNNVWRYIRFPVSALATIAWKSLNGKFASKNHFPIDHFMLPLLTLTLEV